MPAKSLLWRWLSGEASPEEAAMVDTWIESSGENKEAVERLWARWQILTGKADYVPPEVAREWEILEHKLRHPGNANVSQEYPPALGPRQGILRLTLVVAGGIILMGVLLFLLLHRPPRKVAGLPPSLTAEPPLISERQSGDAILRDTLAYNTVVVLDAHSDMRFATVGACTPEIEINGSAVIQTETAQASLPAARANSLTVHAGSLTIHAERARFFVSSDSILGIVRLHILKGSLQLEGPHGSAPLREKAQGPVLLQEGQSLVYNDKLGHSEPKGLVDENTYGFATMVFVFKDAPLKEVIARLSGAYGVHFVVADPRLLNCRITTQFDNESIQDVLDIIAETLNTRYEFKHGSKTIYLSGKGCS